MYDGSKKRKTEGREVPEFSAALRVDDRGRHQNRGMPFAENQDAGEKSRGLRV